MIVVCKEHDKQGNRKPKCYKVYCEINDRSISYLELRSRYNPELEYYITRVDERIGDEGAVELFEKSKRPDEPLFIKL